MSRNPATAWVCNWVRLGRTAEANRLLCSSHIFNFNGSSPVLSRNSGKNSVNQARANSLNQEILPPASARITARRIAPSPSPTFSSGVDGDAVVCLGSMIPAPIAFVPHRPRVRKYAYRRTSRRVFNWDGLNKCCHCSGKICVMEGGGCCRMKQPILKPRVRAVKRLLMKSKIREGLRL